MECSSRSHETSSRVQTSLFRRLNPKSHRAAIRPFLYNSPPKNRNCGDLRLCLPGWGSLCHQIIVHLKQLLPDFDRPTMSDPFSQVIFIVTSVYTIDSIALTGNPASIWSTIKGLEKYQGPLPLGTDWSICDGGQILLRFDEADFYPHSYLYLSVIKIRYERVFRHRYGKSCSSKDLQARARLESWVLLSFLASRNGSSFC